MKSHPFLVSEELLLRKLNRRDEQAFYWLYDQYAHVLYGVVLTGVGQPALASQVVEDVFVRAWADFDQFDPRKTTLLTWLLARARLQAAAAAPPAATDHRVTDNKLSGNLISEDQRNLLEAVYFRGQSLPQLAQSRQQPELSLHQQLRAVLQELKSAFTQ